MEIARAQEATSIHAQLSYLAQDRELAALIWQIAALPEESRLIVRMMVAHLSGVQGSQKRG